MKEIEKTGKTLDEAIDSAIKELGVNRDQVQIEVIDEPNKGFFGFLGNKLAKVKVIVNDVDINQQEQSLSKSSIDKPMVNNDEAIKEAKKLLTDIFNAMKFDVQMELLKREDHIYVNLVGPDMGILIGRRGDTLDALQYLLNLAVNKSKENRIRFVLDVEGYRQRREKTLQNLAMRLADKAKRKGQDVVLEPMNPHERRIIHTALQEVDGVSTRSEGEEPYRKIVILPKR